MLRQSGHINSGERVHIYSADMRRTVSLQFYPDGYELVEPQPVLISQGYSSHQAGVQGRQKLPEVFRVQRGGGEPQEIFLDREIDMEAWQINDKVVIMHLVLTLQFSFCFTPTSRIVSLQLQGHCCASLASECTCCYAHMNSQVHLDLENDMKAW